MMAGYIQGMARGKHTSSSEPESTTDMTIKQLCMNLHFFHGLVSAMNIILGHYNLTIHLELMV